MRKERKAALFTESAPHVFPFLRFKSRITAVWLDIRLITQSDCAVLRNQLNCNILSASLNFVNLC